MNDKEKKKYIEGIGRRKEASARVRLYRGKDSGFVVNEKKLDEYFNTDANIKTARESYDLITPEEQFEISVHVAGGGKSSQAESIRLGVARALIELDENHRSELKERGFLTRDSRVKERKKFGKKKARKSPQWSKR